MKLIKYLSDHFLLPKTIDSQNFGDWNIRTAVRGILYNERNEIALMQIKKFGMYKLPGGGVDPGENLEETFKREIMEETGCNIIEKEILGITIEKRDKWKMFQISYCFKAKVVKVSELSLTNEEIESGFSLVWSKSLKEAEIKIQNGKSKRYDDLYIKGRDSSILNFANLSKGQILH